MLTALIVFAAKYLIAISAGLALAYGLLCRRKREFFTFAFMVLVVSYVFSVGMGRFYYDPQPFVELGTTPLIPHEIDNAFPSHHTLIAAALAASVTPFYLPLAGVLWLFALLIGSARVAALVHHPVDVIASFLIVIIASLVLARLSHLRWRKRAL